VVTVVDPFDAIAQDYDALFTDSAIGLTQRRSVWKEIDKVFQPGRRILEIACGTGVDALHLAGRGARVLACDSSPQMIEVAKRRLEASPFRDRVEFRTLAIEQIAALEAQGPFDGVLSNFSGLNCVRNLKRVALDLARLSAPTTQVILCLFGRACLWEIFWYLARGDIQKAFRRRQARVVARLPPGCQASVHYHSVRSVKEEFSPYFHLRSWRGVGIAVPPPYLESLAQRFPRLFRGAAVIDPILGVCPGLRGLGDHVVFKLERTEA